MVRRSFQLLEAYGAGLARRRFYVNGVRVPFGRFWAIVNGATRQDSFHTIRRDGRFLHFSRAEL